MNWSVMALEAVLNQSWTFSGGLGCLSWICTASSLLLMQMSSYGLKQQRVFAFGGRGRRVCCFLGGERKPDHRGWVHAENVDPERQGSVPGRRPPAQRLGCFCRKEFQRYKLVIKTLKESVTNCLVCTNQRTDDAIYRRGSPGCEGDSVQLQTFPKIIWFREITHQTFRSTLSHISNVRISGILHF